MARKKYKKISVIFMKIMIYRYIAHQTKIQVGWFNIKNHYVCIKDIVTEVFRR